MESTATSINGGYKSNDMLRYVFSKLPVMYGVRNSPNDMVIAIMKKKKRRHNIEITTFTFLGKLGFLSFSLRRSALLSYIPAKQTAIARKNKGKTIKK